MAMNITQDKAYRWATQALILVLVLVAAYAVMLYLRIDEAEATAARVRADADKATQDGGAARKKLQDQLNAKTAEVEAKQREVDTFKALFGKLEPDVAPVLDAGAKAGKPETRAAALATAGLIAQIAHGANNEAAIGTLMKALALDKNNCVASVAANLGGATSVEVPADCQALMPKPPAAAAKPAAAPGPAAPAPAADAGKAAPAAKN